MQQPVITIDALFATGQQPVGPLDLEDELADESLALDDDADEPDPELVVEEDERELALVDG